MLKLIFLILASLNLHAYVNSQQPYCSTDDIKPVVDPSSLPKLPGEFQMRFQATINDEKTADGLILYDSYDRRAELIFTEADKRIRQIYYYDKNEFFTIIGNDCLVQKFNESNSLSFFFSLVVTPEGFNMNTPQNVLHFNNGFPHMKVETVNWRGIPANHYRSCQKWDDIGANFIIDYYFKVPEFKPSVYYDDEFQEIPITAIIRGTLTSKSGRVESFTSEYNYFEFRSRVEIKEDLNVLPEGFYCRGQTDKMDLPEIPRKFSFTEEIIVGSIRSVLTSKVHYDYDSKLVRYDIVNVDPTTYRMNAPLKIINDFTSGVGYVIDKTLGNCTMYPIGLEADSISLGANGGVDLKDPYQFLYLNNETYFYAGQKLERGLKCSMYVSNVTDFVAAALPVQPPYWIFEVCFLSVDQAEVGNENYVSLVPIAVRITSPQSSERFVINVYDFDPSDVPINVFDVSSCYPGKQKKQFGIKFNYPANISITPEIFEHTFEKSIEKIFFVYTFNLLSQYNLSPLRITPPKIRAQKDGFVVYSGFNDNPAPINHFKMKESYRVDVEQVITKLSASSPENCAQLCLDSAALANTDFECFSFDYCEAPEDSGTPSMCLFYNSSFITNPQLILGPEPTCTHYAKNVKTFDSVKKENAYRILESAVVRNEFNLDFLELGQFIRFPAVDIFPATLDGSTDSAINAQIGSTSYYSRFETSIFGADFNEENIKKNNSLTLRKKKGVSIDECCRLCITEPAFDCQSLSYEVIQGECKWSSFVGALSNFLEGNPYLIEDSSYVWYTKNQLYNYIKYPLRLSTSNDLIEVDVGSGAECAFKCTSETSFSCRSFNLCEYPDSQDTSISYKCYLSNTHNNNPEKDPNLQNSPLCDHYSRRTIDDFKLVPNTQLNVKPSSEYLNATVDICASLCEFMDSYLCRSFDFFTNENMCYLYKENLKDQSFENVQGVDNPLSQHYSRVYLTENGFTQTIQPKPPVPNKTEDSNKYSGGAIFGIVFALFIVGVLLGGGLTIVYARYIRKGNNLPAMSYKNLNST